MLNRTVQGGSTDTIHSSLTLLVDYPYSVILVPCSYFSLHILYQGRDVADCKPFQNAEELGLFLLWLTKTCIHTLGMVDLWCSASFKFNVSSVSASHRQFALWRLLLIQKSGRCLNIKRLDVFEHNTWKGSLLARNEGYQELSPSTSQKTFA